ncbi:hypothetical protein [Fulvivirga sedimenti]|uniref:Secreted protein n=1 Tax=Fulvivirga sedimenti TaxID=2879465 RepID=A0A9X1KW96_9BACT|nr:hypothetical protein [Fulvivirga sedimenti]MCA6074486.1 hypothetical protein [Fulvivirga sedimenti]MCA6075663.1 hypothetical protein [Fulvivirga sedimenti]MCA6076791.1 hypothetical protein [Fulvivirga sedimenti]
MKRLRLIFMCLSLLAFVSSCNDDEPTANVSINEVQSDLGGDVTGDGGSIIRSYSWNNPQARAEYNMDITAAKGGSFRLVMEDADGNVVSDYTLTRGVGDDSKYGVSTEGTPGDWTITITLTDFVGDGSFSINPGA